jgi:hypothetical protein
VEVADGALHDPALATKPGAVLGTASSYHWDDPTSPELPAVLVVVVATVGQYPIGLSAWVPDAARDRRLAP